MEPTPDSRRRTALPTGFRAEVGFAGVRANGADDVAVVVSDRPCSSAGMFTRSRFAGPSVTLSRPRAAAGTARAFVVVAGNANVATGPQGEHHAAELATLAAGAAGVDPSEQLVASTGVIGRPYPMPPLRAWFAALTAGDPARWQADAGDVARAIMTTDLVAKTAVRLVGPAKVVGMAKGVG